ncbi:MAG TPA: sigma factor, partial [Microthrixaceae bacterium]|nr:sigma factor [Microthrixaceae bacterium]
MAEFADEAMLVRALQARDESAFAFLVDRDHRWLFRLARQYVSSDSVALEVVQDTWLAVIEGIDRFEGRSTLRTWLARIVMNQARTRGVREARTVPFASAGDPGSQDGPGGFDLDRFAARGSARGHWTDPPDDWSTIPAERLEAAEVRAVTRD